MTQRSPILSAILAGFLLATCSWSALQAETARYITVPAVAVSNTGGKQTGNVYYIVLQLERDPQGRGPTILFSEAGAGSVVDDVWKNGARTAMTAASHLVGEDARNWTLTIKNRSRYSQSGGPSASSAVAVGIAAAWRGDSLRSDLVLTGVIDTDGTIDFVGHLPAKLEGAATAKMHALLVPKGEARTSEWDLFDLGQKSGINVVEVETLREAYEFMTGIRP